MVNESLPFEIVCVIIFDAPIKVSDEIVLAFSFELNK